VADLFCLGDDCCDLEVTMTLHEAAREVLDTCTDAVLGWESLAPLSVRQAALQSLDALRAALNQSKPLTADETMHLLNATSGIGYWCEEAHIQRFRAAIEKHHGVG
jgi:hypothetical protein